MVESFSSSATGGDADEDGGDSPRGQRRRFEQHDDHEQRGSEPGVTLSPNVTSGSGASGSGTSGSSAVHDAGVPEADARVVDAWRVWLAALATDAEAAMAAAIAYQGLGAQDRDHWLSALEQDTSRIGVPRIAVYAPLLAVEVDPARRARIEAAMGPAEESATPSVTLRCLRGVDQNGLRVAAIVSPLYLDFVQVLACGYSVGEGFRWVKHDPILDDLRAPRSGQVLGEAALEDMPLKSLVDELALAVLAHQRRGREIPEALRIFADLFGPQPDGSTPPSSRT